MKDPRRVRLEIHGVVQGVGFRPFLHRLAKKYRLTGWAKNVRAGVVLELQGELEALNAFQRELTQAPPPLAVMEQVCCRALEGLASFDGFRLLPSESEGPGSTLAPADMALCPDCLRELQTPQDRRYRYPFLNCTNCGPRYSILRALPYDRQNTSMEPFAMCPDCQREYQNINDRRYHAQPDCCPVCGPKAFYRDETGAPLPGDPIRLAQEALAQGKVLAVKGVGGIHLACDAKSQEAVLRLRGRKRREEKPLAVMCRSLEAARSLCKISPAEEALLSGAPRPIVLLEKQAPGSFSWLSATRRLGVMLPYSPLHVLLLDQSFGGPDCVVMTSANRPGQPVMIENEDALEGLQGIADGFLLHNRPIENRCDDSLALEWEGAPYFLRRSRGYAPQPVALQAPATGVWAFGAEQKASFALGRGAHAFISPHIGDLKNLEALAHYQAAMGTYRRLFQAEPLLLACDLHPDYLSTRQAEELSHKKELPLLRIQHHWAHMAACMEDNRLQQPVFGIIWDGSGLGTDGAVWGGEFLKGDFSSFSRAGSIRPILLAGGDAAVGEIGRIAAALLLDAGLPLNAAPLPEPRREQVAIMLQNRVNCTPASSVGRLFDGVYALLSQRGAVSYEGQGAALLEATVRPEVPGREYPVCFEQEGPLRRFDFRPLIRGIAADLRRGIPAAAVARGFMDALCQAAANQCAALNPQRDPVVLSGGVFQNYYLLSNLTRLLRGAGFLVFPHKRVSTNDEGLCLGQLAIAQRSKEYHVLSSSAEDNPA